MPAGVRSSPRPPGAQAATQSSPSARAGSSPPMPVPPKQVQPSPGSPASSCRAAGMSAGATRRRSRGGRCRRCPAGTGCRSGTPAPAGGVDEEAAVLIGPAVRRPRRVRPRHGQVVNRSPTASGALGPVGGVPMRAWPPGCRRRRARPGRRAAEQPAAAPPHGSAAPPRPPPVATVPPPRRYGPGALTGPCRRRFSRLGAGQQWRSTGSPWPRWTRPPATSPATRNGADVVPRGPPMTARTWCCSPSWRSPATPGGPGLPRVVPVGQRPGPGRAGGRWPRPGSASSR